MKYIIDIPDDTTYVNAIKAIDGDVVRATTIPMIDLASYTEPDRKAIDLQHAHDIENVARMNYSKGAEDAWEFARRIICPSDCCEDSISKYTKKFLGIPAYKTRAIFKDFSYQEVKAKYEAWKKEKEEFHVGDEVECCDIKGIVYIVKEDSLEGLYMNSSGVTSFWWVKDRCKKTGRHFDDVENLLDKLGE